MGTPTPHPQEVASGGLFAVLSRPTGLWRDDSPLLASHIGFLKDLERQGVTVLSGPLGIDDDGWHGHGLTVIRAASMAEARELMSADPYLAAGLRACEIMPWLITSGRIIASMTISDADSSIR